MPAYSFQKHFVPFIESGEKTHTIRGKRVARPRPGQPFYGYYGMRTKQCRKIIESTITHVRDLYISPEFIIQIDGETLTRSEAETLAVRDGFTDLDAMKRFWPSERLPFFGEIIHWRYPGKVVPR